MFGNIWPNKEEGYTDAKERECSLVVYHEGKIVTDQWVSLEFVFLEVCQYLT